tara:strand:- start:533 stop:805 length:273 start_codon:yes stop_codon:yes gene_type:complete
MKLSRKSLRKLLREVYEEVRVEGALGHAAEKMAQMLQRKYGDETAIKLLTYALDTIQPGLYQPSEIEREEFMQEPFPGSRKRMSGKIDFK